MVTDGSLVHVLHREHTGYYRHGFVYAVSLMTVDVNKVAEPVAASQTVTIPADLPQPTLSWRYELGHLKTPSSGGRLRIGVASDTGWQELATLSESTAPVNWVDLSPWLGQTVTLTFRFAQHGDPTAWAWIDDVHLTGLPLNAGVSLTRGTEPVRAGENMTVYALLANRRAGDLLLQMEMTWPAGWALSEASMQPYEIGDGVAQFQVPVAQGDTAPLQITLQVPADTPRSGHSVTARLLPPEMDYDYTPDDNEAHTDFVVDGLQVWLPAVNR
jgi:hypothetical protein